MTEEKKQEVNTPVWVNITLKVVPLILFFIALALGWWIVSVILGLIVGFDIFLIIKGVFTNE